MQFKQTSSVTNGGVRTSPFVMGADVSGNIWMPESTGQPALILLAPGGGQDVNSPGIAQRAEHFARHGFASAAINAPGQGGRVPSEEYRRLTAQLDVARSDRTELTKAIEAVSDHVAQQVVPELGDLVDALSERGLIAPESHIGFWGLSQGAVVGLRLARQEPRLTAAVLGLAGAPHLVEQAGEIHVPVQYVVQWDDRLVARRAALDVFEALASADKTL
ncbi:MAG TPA: hypothetical protein VD789_11720, partial [Thermomicrobiales bacterium]|nr:hypothetical protein [Thermomicrobiales bacterium]